MERSKAIKIARGITFEELNQMFDNAKMSIKDWNLRSEVNKGMTKGKAWNIFFPCLRPDVSESVKVNMIREFGKYMSRETWERFVEPVSEKVYTPPYHEEPEFNNGLGKCLRCNISNAVIDYNGYGHYVCAHCNSILESEFDNYEN